MSKIKTWEAVCKKYKVDPKQMPEVNWMPEVLRRPAELNYMVMMITMAFNPKGFDPDYTNYHQRKYCAWVYLIKDETAPSGFRLAFGGYDCDDDYAGIGARLVFASSEIAKQAVETFPDIFMEYLLNKAAK